MKYKILEDIATADIAYQIFGRTIEELFMNAAEAVMATMVDTATVKPQNNSELRTQNSKLEELFLDFLNELIFLKDTKQMVFSQFNIKLDKLDARRYLLDASCWGEKIDYRRHILKVDVKAVTRHKFFLKREKNKYVAQIVLDV